MASLISASDLQTLLSENKNVKLIDVRLQDEYDFNHISGAQNNCVFEVSFLKRANEKLKKDDEIVVYGDSAKSYEARTAAAKLIRDGFTNVKEYRDGVHEYQGPQTCADLLIDRPFVKSGKLEIDVEESLLEWTGRNLVNKHRGRIGLKSGNIVIEKGLLAAGSEFVIDMEDISCYDLAANQKMHDVLIAHLKNDDFFDVELFKEASLKVTKVDPIDECTPGSPNAHVVAELTLKGITDVIEFDITSGFKMAKDQVSTQWGAQCHFAWDRTRFNVLYGSGKFFKVLAGHLVNDMIHMDVKLVSKPTKTQF